MPNHAKASHPASRDRLLAFAFAGAELLVEMEPNGTITWAAGAFPSHFGQSADSFIGCNVTRLIAPVDQDALLRTLIFVTMRGRTAPVVLHLNDTAASPCAFAALKLPGPLPRVCVTLGPLPSPPPAKSDCVQPAPMFAREAEARLGTKQAGMLSFLDVKGWTEATANLDGNARNMLRDDIGAALGSVTDPDALVGELAEGRYGVVSRRQVDIVMLASGLEAFIQTKPTGHSVSVDGTALDLADTRLQPVQAVRALRFALSKFAEGGLAAVENAGFATGLAGFIAQARKQSNAMRNIIERRQFDLVFQRVVNLSNRTVSHYEALLRPFAVDGTPWTSTQDFVTCAESLGLAEELDLAVMEQVLAVLGRISDCSIATNVSGLSMQSVAFRERLLSLLPSGSYRRLLVELTETAEIQDVATAVTTLDLLRASNIGLCIDDFGAGNAAYRYLRGFRMEYVKIDGAYVQAALHSKREREIVTSMIVLARSVGAQTIAEMIETNEQAHLMEELGCTHGQGWLFGKPGPLPESA